MKTSKLLFILSLVLLTLSCCKKDDDQPIQQRTVLLSDDIKDYCLFKPGTYWVYQNSKTMELDSVYVTSVDTSMRNVADDKVSVDYQDLYLRAHSSFDNYYDIYALIPPLPTNVDTRTPAIEKGKSKPGDYIGITTYFVTPLNIGLAAYLYSPSGQDRKLTLEEIKPSFTLNSNTFTNVLVYDNEEDVTYDRTNVKYYIARNVGIIKKEFVNENESWELIRYHIEE